MDKIGDLLASTAKGEKHIVRLKVDTTLHGALAVQYKLLRLLKDKDFNDHSFLNMVLICGIAEISKTLLKELLSVKGVSYSMLKELFDEFGKAI